MKKKEEIILQNFLMVTLVLGILMFSIVSLNTEHMDVCHDDGCTLCEAIEFSQKLVIILMVTILTLGTVLFLVSYFMAERYQIPGESVTVIRTLVSQKIQMNE